jgi:hypothetical protein
MILSDLCSDSGVVVLAGIATPATLRAGLKAATLCAVNRSPVASISELRAAVAKLKAGDSVALQIERAGQTSASRLRSRRMIRAAIKILSAQRDGQAFATFKPYVTKSASSPLGTRSRHVVDQRHHLQGFCLTEPQEMSLSIETCRNLVIPCGESQGRLNNAICVIAGVVPELLCLPKHYWLLQISLNSDRHSCSHCSRKVQEIREDVNVVWRGKCYWKVEEGVKP